jgi:hypothetical protein
MMTNTPLPLSPHKQANPLGWPFGALPPKVLLRLLNEKKRNDIAKAPPALF